MKKDFDKCNGHIAFVTPSMLFGGAERVMSILMNELVERNYHVSLIYLNDTHTISYSLSEKVNIYFVKGVRLNTIRNFVSPIKKLRKIFINIQPDVIISFFNNTSCFSWLSQLGLNTPIIFSERNDPNNNIKGFKALFFQRWALSISNKIVFQTQGARSFYTSKAIQEKSVVIYNPLNKHKEKVDYCFRNYNLVSVGRLSRQKNQKILIEAINKLKDKYPQLKLTIYGEGNLRKDLEEQILKLGLSNRVLLPGNESNVIDKIIDYRLFVFSSDYEGIPNALLEAMSIGLPCVSTDCSPGGAREFIRNYENGILVPCDDANAMANAIDYHLLNAESSQLMGMNAKRISELLDVDVILNKWLHLFDSIK